MKQLKHIFLLMGVLSGMLNCGTGQSIVSAVLTTDDRAQLMSPQPSLKFETAHLIGYATIYVDEHEEYQTIEGFGAAFTDSAAYLLNQVATASVREKVLRDVFGREGKGIGLSFMRNPMGATDIARSLYSFDDNNDQPDPDLDHFTIAHDKRDIIPIILRARQINPSLRIIANPWSPPGWMKTSESMIGGSLLPNMHGSFAKYFVKYLEAYKKEGVAIDYISLQNEPLYDVSLDPAPYPGMLMDAATQAEVLRNNILPTFSANKINTRILIYDHRWTDPDYPQSVLADPTISSSPQVAGIAWHGYAGTPGIMTPMQSTYVSEGQYVTEHSGFTTDPDHVKLDFENIIHIMKNWSKAYVKWSLALDQNQGPHTGGCATCTPLVMVDDPSGQVTYTIEYYTMGQFSKYALPGAQRIFSTDAPGIISLAFINPDNSKALIVFNDTSDKRTFAVRWGNQSFLYTLPGLSGATLVWSGTQLGSYKVDSRSQIQASSFNRTGRLLDDNCLMTSTLQTEKTSDLDAGFDLVSGCDGDYALYSNVYFGAHAPSRIAARVACGSILSYCAGALEFHLDGATGPTIGTISIPSTPGGQSWSTITAGSVGAIGVHELYVVFRASGAMLNWFRFGD